ncbi:MAG: HTH domain-containing protein [Saprospiraceae bacterium]|nr:HTH domain-containing protein [Saprospiraceae bacterium]WKZ64430.1 MAG: ATP-binding protein [Saprospiraceae bacterium]
MPVIPKDIMSSGDIQIKIFDDFITFFNPGTLHQNLTIEDLKTNSYPAYARNKLLSEAFYLTGEIEKYGSGFLRIRNAIRQYPTMKLEFKEIGGGFMAKISYTKQKISLNIDSSIVIGGVNDGINGGVNGGVNEIENLIRENPGINTGRIKEALNMSQRTVERSIKKLRQQGKIIFKGAPKTGGYYIVYDADQEINE